MGVAVTEVELVAVVVDEEVGQSEDDQNRGAEEGDDEEEVGFVGANLLDLHSSGMRVG